MDKIKEIIAEMRKAVKEDADWSQPTGDCVKVELVEKWAAQLEDALDDERFDG